MKKQYKHLTRQEKKFIEDNYNSMTIKQIALTIHKPFNTVYRVVNRIETNSTVKVNPTVIKRPPAVYSNPQWNTILNDPNYCL